MCVWCGVVWCNVYGVVLVVLWCVCVVLSVVCVVWCEVECCVCGVVWYVVR